jgi:hypothetical protein
VSLVVGYLSSPVFLWVLVALALGWSVVAFMMDRREHREWIASMEQERAAIPNAEGRGPRVASVSQESGS